MHTLFCSLFFFLALFSFSLSASFDPESPYVVVKYYDAFPCSGAPRSYKLVQLGACYNMPIMKGYSWIYTYSNGVLDHSLCYDDVCGNCGAAEVIQQFGCEASTNNNIISYELVPKFPVALVEGATISVMYNGAGCQGSIPLDFSVTPNSSSSCTGACIIFMSIRTFCSYQSLVTGIATSSTVSSFAPASITLSDLSLSLPSSASPSSSSSSSSASSSSPTPATSTSSSTSTSFPISTSSSSSSSITSTSSTSSSSSSVSTSTTSSTGATSSSSDTEVSTSTTSTSSESTTTGSTTSETTTPETTTSESTTSDSITSDSTTSSISTSTLTSSSSSSNTTESGVSAASSLSSVSLSFLVLLFVLLTNI